MSNTNTTPVVCDETAVVPAPVETKPKKKKNVASRVFAAILVAIAVGAMFVPFVNVITFAGVEKTSFFAAIQSVFGDGAVAKLFGVIPSLTPTEPINGLLCAVFFYLLLLCVVFTVIFGIVTIFCSKKAPKMLRVTTWFFAFGFLAYSLCGLLFNYIYTDKIVLDLVCLGLTGVGILMYFVLACAKLKGKAVMNLFQFILSLIVSVAVVLVIAKDTATYHAGLDTFGIAGDTVKIVSLALIGLATLSLMLATIRIATKKGLTIDMIRYILLLLVAGVLLYFQFTATEKVQLIFILSIVAAGVALVQMILCIIQICVAKKAKKKAKAAIAAALAEEEAPAEEVAPVAEEAVVEETVEAVVEEEAPAEEEFVREEFVEAVPYEGGPVEGVEMAEEVVEEEPAPAPAPAVETADYDYYNSRSFDAFIATLSGNERNQFTELFVLKYKGTMPEIPEYQVGGNNKEFFRKVFIYLGQYRDRIPDELLAKMYQFAVKL